MTDDFRDYGDRVRLVQNPRITGQVIGERNWGSEYHVRLAATATCDWFDHIELELDPQYATDVGARATDEDQPEGDNVIPLKKAGGVH